jgi:hypothetical protein
VDGHAREDLLALADWLRSWQVTKTGMEAACFDGY